MIKILSVDATRDAEKQADDSGISYAAMMERAGRAVAERAMAVLQRLPNPAEAQVTVLVGPGNNGGDGLVAGRIIAQESSARVRFYLVKERDPSKDDVFKAAQDTGAFIAFADDDTRYRVLTQLVASATLVIDALFGIGTTPPLRADAVKIFRAANKALADNFAPDAEGVTYDPTAPYVPRAGHPYILAVDCPSGLNCDTGEIDPNALPAEETVSFIGAKTGLFQFPGAASVGDLRVATLGIADDLPPLKDAQTMLIDAAYVHDHLPARPADGHKGTYGRALIAGGSVNYSGAPGMAAMAAYKSGAGLVSVGAPSGVVAVLAGRLLEVTWLMLPSDLGALASGAATVLADELKERPAEALLFGPGVGRETTTRELLERLLTSGDPSHHPARALGFLGAAQTEPEGKKANKKDDPNSLPPLVIDADGLNLLSELDDWHTLLPAETILTPHPGEMARLCGIETKAVQADRWTLAQEKAKAWNCIVVLKGAHTVIAAPDGRLAVAPFKTSALATAGTGDVLAGLTVGLRAQGMPAFEAAACGVYVHGMAGVLAADRLGSTRAVSAGDVLESLAAAFRALRSA
ncbi:MAG: bifunctional ADP-dependent NAD(P)H-hydrate dehydratase/NAD(P)H-hydrate epimerase [Anaerolineae bacterium]|nr:bifunctional ADP-dependent NAD(P)H-hydrate dehydratase/NAD(P)H-hydrate epimerase [Anaerolineae bacterium]